MTRGKSPDMHVDFKNSFWSFNVGHAITIMLMLISVVGLYFKVDARVTAVEKQSINNELKLERIDENGTRRSQLGLSQETELIRSHTNRITELEKAVSALTPKIERIDVNIQWIMTQQQQIQNHSMYRMPDQPNRHTGR